eukprot:IDg5766t1
MRSIIVEGLLLYRVARVLYSLLPYQLAVQILLYDFEHRRTSC